MKCNVCHNEFGNGEYCQNCKADKVVGLGNYTGYNAPNVQHNITHQTPQQRTTQMADCNMTICYKCANPIPVDVVFCPVCGLKLTSTCPKCGNKFSSQYAFCSSCGVNVEEFIAEQKRKDAAEQASRIAEQKRREAVILAVQQHQAELQRIAEAKRQEELRKKVIAMQQPEFVDALAYIKKMLDNAYKRKKRYSIYGALFGFCFGFYVAVCVAVCVAFGININIYEELFDEMLFIALIIGFCGSIFFGQDVTYEFKQLINVNKYIARNQIANERTKRLVEEYFQLVKYKNISSFRREPYLIDMLLEAYFKISESSK